MKVNLEAFKYYREHGRYYYRKSTAPNSRPQEISFAELLRSHQIARELMDDTRDAESTRREAERISRGLGE